MPPAQPRTTRSASASRNSASGPAVVPDSSGTGESQVSTSDSSGRMFGPSLPFLPNANLVGPVPDSFDFERHMTVPEGIARFGIPLGIRIQRNVEIERYNDESISTTVDVLAIPSPRPPDLDVGPALKLSYCYTETELKELANSQALCDSLGPFPPSLIRQIAASRARGKKEAELVRQAEKEKEREIDSSIRNKLLGTMEMQNPVKRVFGEAKETVIPTIFLLNIRNRLIPPLHFFTNNQIELVHTSPQVIHTKFVRLFGIDEQCGEKVQLLDLGKMITLWGNDDVYECLSPLRFLEASKNLLAALQLLCKPPTESTDPLQAPTSNSTNYAIEYKKHLSYFKQMNDFEDTFALWYGFEREARMDILLGNVVFDWAKYAARVHIILQTRQAVEHTNLPSRSKVPRLSIMHDVSSARAPTNKFFSG
ncbi:hypothetical protein C0992_004369 [Termitomyces sp. T32_za158]|nr:hypothetical protein C0992_004369 [Termitomyces sp. T32_za158]